MPTKAELEEELEKMKDLNAALELEVDQMTESLEQISEEPVPPADRSDLAGFVARCRTPFPEDQVGKLIRSGCKDCKNAGRWEACKKHNWVRSGQCQVPNCNGNHESSAVHLDYVGHAEVTARLLELDPEWYWEPVAFDPEGKPVITKRETMASMWIYLTVNGVTRLGVGTCETFKDEVEKELIGDAIRNVAMRFGIALDLWSKSEKLDGTFGEEPNRPAPVQEQAATTPTEPATDTGAPEPAAASQGETAAPPDPPAKPSNGGVDRETVINAFMQLRGQHAKDARLILEDAGMWPVLDVPEDRLDEAAGLIGPILDLQKREGGK